MKHWRRFFAHSAKTRLIDNEIHCQLFFMIGYQFNQLLLAIYFYIVLNIIFIDCIVFKSNGTQVDNFRSFRQP